MKKDFFRSTDKNLHLENNINDRLKVTQAIQSVKVVNIKKEEVISKVEYKPLRKKTLSEISKSNSKKRSKSREKRNPLQTKKNKAIKTKSAAKTDGNKSNP